MNKNELNIATEKTPFARFFGSSTKAFVALIGAILILAIVYIVYQSVRTKTPNPWADAIEVSEVRYLAIEVNRLQLSRFFSQREIDAWKQEHDERFDRERAIALQSRKRAVDSVIDFASTRASNSNLARHLAYLVEGSHSDETYQQVDLDKASELLRQLRNLSEGASGEQEAVQSLILATLVLEATVKSNLEADKKDFKPNITFTWLYHEGSGWIGEIVVWSVFGVLLNALTALIRFHKEKTYDPRTFPLVLPRLALAPILAIVLIAMVVAGFTETTVDLNSLPVMLAVAFLLGFNAENLAATVRSFSGRIFANEGDLLIGVAKLKPVKTYESPSTELNFEALRRELKAQARDIVNFKVQSSRET